MSCANWAREWMPSLASGVTLDYPAGIPGDPGEKPRSANRLLPMPGGASMTSAPPRPVPSSGRQSPSAHLPAPGLAKSQTAGHRLKRPAEGPQGFLTTICWTAIAVPVILGISGVRRNACRLDHGTGRDSLTTAMMRSAIVMRNLDACRRRECVVDAHIAAGEVTVHADGEAVLGHLDMVDTRAADD